MKKNILVLFVMLVMVSCLALAGCSKEKASDAPATQSGQQQGAESSGSGNELADLMKSARQVEGMSYEMTSTVSMQGQNQTSQSKMWVSKDKVRMETEMAGMKSVMISDGKDIYMYQPSSNTAMKLSSVDKQEQLANKWAEDDSYLSKMKVVGEEKMDGFDCLVVSVKDEQTDSKMWLRKDIGMPVRMESNVSGNNVVIEYKNTKIGAQDDSLFVLPAGAQVVDMPAMPQQP